MDSVGYKVVLDEITGPVDPAKLPTLDQLLDWTRRLYDRIAPADRYGVLFSVWSFPDEGRRGFAGFSVQLAEQFDSATHDGIKLLIERRDLSPDDPLFAHGLESVAMREYPSAEAFFAALPDHTSYKFAAAYPFDEVSIRPHLRAVLRAEKAAEQHKPK